MEPHRDILREPNFEDLFETDSFAEVGVVIPEVPRGNGIVDGPTHLNFQNVADRKRLDRDVLLAFVRVHWRFAAYGGIEFLNVETLDVNYARVRKPDGTVVETPASDKAAVKE